MSTKKKQKKFTASHVDLIIFLGLLIVFGLFSVSQGQDVNWDLRNYHYYNAYAFLTGRLTKDIAPAFMQTYLNPLLDTFNYLLITAGKAPKIIAFAMGSFSAIAVFFLVKIAKILFYSEPLNTRICYIILSIAIGTTGVASHSQIGTFTNEYTISIFVMGAIYFALSGLYTHKNIRKRYGYLFLAGLLIGLGTGLKLTAASYAIALVVATFLADKKYLVTEAKLTGVVFCGVALGFLITDGFWMLKLYHLFDNPLFPYYNNIFHSPYAAISDYADRRFLPKSLIQYFFYPFYWLKENNLTAELEFLDARFAIVLFFSFLVLLKSISTSTKRKPQVIFSNIQQKHIAHFLFLFWIVSYTLWLIKFSIMRYTIPLEMISGLLISYFCMALFKSNWMRLIILVVMAITIISTTRSPDWGHTSFQRNFIQIQGIPVTLPTKSLVLLISKECPLAYVIPYFSAETTFIMLQDPNGQQLHTKQIYHTILNYHGPLYSLSDPSLNTTAYLASVNLKEAHETCVSIKSNLDQTPVALCQLNRF